MVLGPQPVQARITSFPGVLPSSSSPLDAVRSSTIGDHHAPPPRRHPVPRTPQRTPVATWRTPPPGRAPLGQVRTPQRLAGATMWTALGASPRSCLGRRCRVGEQSNGRGCSGRRTRLYRPPPEGRLHPRHQHSQSAPPALPIDRWAHQGVTRTLDSASPTHQRGKYTP